MPKLSQYGGMLPSWDESLLPPGQASYSQNAYLFSGALIGWRKPKVLRTLDDNLARFAYRIPRVTQTQARATLIFKANPNNGDVISIGDFVYTFRTSLAEEFPFTIKIEATAAETARNFVAALTVDFGEATNEGTYYTNGTYAHQDLRWYKPGTDIIPGLGQAFTSTINFGGTDYTFVLIGAKNFGEAYNSIVLVDYTSGARLLWIEPDATSLSDTTNTLVGGTNPSFEVAITSDSDWLEFRDVDTTVVKSPIVDDTYDRYYVASPTEPPRYNTRGRIEASEAFWRLGVPAPGTEPTVEVSGGGNSKNLGHPTPNGTYTGGGANAAFLVPVTSDDDTLLRSVSFRTTSVSTTAKYAAVVYSDTDGAPDELLAVGEIVIGIAAGVQGSEFENPVPFTNGVQYWIGIFTDTHFPLENSITNESDSVIFNSTFTNGPPETAPGTMATDQTTMGIYGTCITDDVIESRSYVYTWVTGYGEEGPPSPPTVKDGWSNATWTVGVWQPTPSESGGDRNITKLNIYRTIPGEAGKTVYFYVGFVLINDLEDSIPFVDNNPNDVVALNDQLSTTNWFPPPASLRGIVAMANGMMAGFTNNEIWFCEPFHPHAWPPTYVMTVDTPIVGLGVSLGALVVCTNSNPYVLSGVAPSQMVQFRCSAVNPCISQACIVSDDSAVFYCSPNGFIQVTPQGQAINTTDLWISREKWQNLTPQLYPRAIKLASSYFCLGAVSRDLADNSEAQEGFTIELAQDNTSFSIWPQPGGHRLGFQLLDSPIKSGDVGVDISNLLTDVWSGAGVILGLGLIWYIDFEEDEPDYQVYTWKSKIFQQNTIRNYSAIKVYFTIPPSTPALNATRIEEAADDPVWETLDSDRYGYIKTYVDTDGSGDMVLVDCREIRKPGELLRIVGGFKAYSWQWEIVSRVEISNVQIATTVKQLALQAGAV